MLPADLSRRVVLLSQVWALLLEKTHPRLASDVIYVAGDRVVRAFAA